MARRRTPHGVRTPPQTAALRRAHRLSHQIRQQSQIVADAAVLLEGQIARVVASTTRGRTPKGGRP